MKTKVIKKDVIIYHNNNRIVIPLDNLEKEVYMKVNELDLTLTKEGIIITEDIRPYGNWGQPNDVNIAIVEGNYEEWDNEECLEEYINDEEYAEECDEYRPPLHYNRFYLLKEGKMTVEQYVNDELTHYTIEVIVYAKTRQTRRK